MERFMTTELIQPVSISMHIFHRICLIIALFLYLTTAVNSSGYYHPDEHYQIIEFAELKLGKAIPQDLPWEYNARIRSAIQPFICYNIIALANSIGIQDPYDQAIILRSLTALLALICIQSFVRSTLSLVEPALQKSYILLAYFLWFLPFINVRFSSETWSGFSFLAALAILLRQPPQKTISFLATGALLGFSFLCRFQSAILTLTLFIWLLVIQKEKAKNLAYMLSSFLAVLALGLLADKWLYGQYTFTSWNYFSTNILKDVSSHFGKAPWYFYLQEIVLQPLFPLGILLSCAILILAVKKTDGLITWLIALFILVHSVIPHKEDRFLFPLANLAPLILVLAAQEITRYRFNKGIRLSGIFLLTVFSLINLTALCIMSARSAGTGRMAITQYIHQHYRNKPVNLITGPIANPYNPWTIFKDNFYKDTQLTEKAMNDPAEISTLIDSAKVNLVVLSNTTAYSQEFKARLHQLGFHKKIQSIPAWIVHTDNLYYPDDPASMLVLYERD